MPIDPQRGLIEFAYYIAPDGLQYPLFGGSRVMLSWQDFGMRPLDYLTERGPFQHGETVRDYRFRSRTVTMQMFEGGRCRQDWYCHEGQLIDALRPNRSSTAQGGKLLLVLPDYTEREIGARITRGPSGDWNAEGSRLGADLQETMQFFCPDPFWNDVQPNLVEAVIDIDSSCLPVCLPTCLGANIINQTFDVMYCGTWDGDTLTILITGPIEAPIIANLTTGKQIKLNYTVAAGEAITIDIQPNQVTVTNNYGVNLIGAVNNLSDLVTFGLAARGDLTPTGLNQINMIGSGGVAGVTSIAVTYLTRHVSVFDPCLACE